MDSSIVSALEDFKDFNADESKEIAETPHRCKKCSKLFFKGSVGEDGRVTVKCGRCGTVNVFTIHTDPQNFQDKIYINRRYRYR